MIYFIQEGEDGPVKIGYSSDPYARLKSMQTGNSSRLCLRKVFQGEREAEAELHERFDDLRIRDDGEWFKPASEVLERVSHFSGRVPIEEIIPEAYDGPMRTEVQVPGNEHMYAYFEVSKRGRYYDARWTDYTIDGYGYPRDRLFSRRVRATGMNDDIFGWWEAHKFQFRHDSMVQYGGSTGNAQYITGQSIPTLQKIVLYHYRAAVKDGLPLPNSSWMPDPWPEITSESIEQYASKNKHSGLIDAIRDYHNSKRQRYDCT